MLAFSGQEILYAKEAVFQLTIIVLFPFLCSLQIVGASIILSPKSTHVEEGSNLTLACIATGQPSPVITWSKIPGELSKRRNTWRIEGNFTIMDISKSDEGVYFCKAENLLHTDKKHAQITVLPKLQFTHATKDKLIVSWGSTVPMHCSTTGAILVSWRRKEGNLQSRHTAYTNGSIEMRSVTKQDAGTYICTARNLYRSIEKTARLVVSLPPSCSHIKAAERSTRSQNYVIDPDGAGGQAPFTVYCDMSDNNGVGVTVVSHDTEARTYVKKKGCGSRGCYSKDVTYTGVSVAQLAGLTAVSSR